MIGSLGMLGGESYAGWVGRGGRGSGGYEAFGKVVVECAKRRTTAATTETVGAGHVATATRYTLYCHPRL